MGEGEVMQPELRKRQLRKLQSSMAISAMAIVIFAIGVSSFEKAPKPPKAKAEAEVEDKELPDGISDIHSDEADEIAKSKIEVLKKQSQLKSVSSKSGRPNPAVTASVPFDARNSAADALSRLVEARKCERLSGAIGQTNVSSACPTGHPLALANPSGYSDLLTQTTVNELAFLKQLAIYARSENQADPFDLAQVAKAYVQHPDDNVKEQALEIAALLPDHDGKVALGIAAKVMESTVSGPLALQALALLSAHRDHDTEQVDKTVTTALRNGGWDVRDAIASQLLPFITPSTRPVFVQILASEPVRSKVALHIRLNLEEFDRMERL